MQLRTTTTIEGATKLLVPSESLERVPPPTSPVFFNPAASLNRHVSVAVAAAVGGSNFCDSLSGVGSRGVRVAKEVGMDVTLVDFNAQALRLGRKSAALNKVASRCRFVESESSAFLSSRNGKDERYDFVDVDPFGTPAPFFAAALSAVAPGGILSFTATDAAVLCGVYSGVSSRRYFASSLNNHFSHETGSRILLGAVCKLAGSVDLGVVPVFAHATRHYFRAYVRVETGATKADAALRNLGYVVWGRHCGHSSVEKEASRACVTCGKAAKIAGPLWAGKVTDKKAVAAARREADERGMHEAARVMAGFIGVDRFPPWSFSLEEISSSLGVPTVSRKAVSSILESSGHSCGSQPFEKEGLKSDASYGEVVAAARASAGLRQA